MAPWLRVGDTMVDIAEAVHIHYEPGVFPSDGEYWREKKAPRLNILLRNGEEVFADFDDEDAGRNTYEMLFRLLMPEIAQALEEAANGSRTYSELGDEGRTPDPQPEAEVLAGDPLGVHDASSLQPERLVFPGDTGGAAGRVDG